MRFAYADPPYLGCGNLYLKYHHDALIWNDPETHRTLIDRLSREFSDGWALSLHSPSLRTILSMCPDDVRIGAWIKPFCSFKPNVNPAYAWEPVIFRGGRKPDRWDSKVRDWVSANITLHRSTPGAKPDAFCWWLFDFLGMKEDDEFVDLFPGSGAVSRAWEIYKLASMPLFRRNDDA
jgi:hypothetical protein